MLKSTIVLLFLYLFSSFAKAQTTDLAVVVEAQNLNGTSISQAHIFEEFQYIITIINSGNDVNNATFSQLFNSNVSILSFESINNIGGASEATSFNLTPNNELLGIVENSPNNSSVQIRVLVKAPQTIGGIAITAIVFAPQDVEDTNISNNESIISIDITDVDIDFSVTYSQINSDPLLNWEDTITYEFTITNNSSIEYPLNDFNGVFNLVTPFEFGQPAVQFQSLECIATNGLDCVDTSTVQNQTAIIGVNNTIFNINEAIVFPFNASITFQVVYKFFDPICTLEPEDIIVNSFIRLNLNHENISSNESNIIISTLLPATLCVVTDIGIETTQISPDVGDLVNWNEEMTLETVVTNHGPNPVPILFFVQNLSINISWEITSLTCIDATNGIMCNDIILTQESLLWSSNIFEIPVDTVITIQFVIRFLEPECSTDTANAIGHLRSGINLQTTEIVDNNILNNAESDFVILPPTPACPIVDIEITKSQINPELPEGTSSNNTTDWGEVTYEVIVNNPSNEDVFIEVSDFFQTSSIIAFGTLQSVNCVSTTGNTECNTINFSQIGVTLDGVPTDGLVDVFWSISEDDEWLLTALSSVTFNVVIDWTPVCSTSPILVTNNVVTNPVAPFVDVDLNNNEASVTTYFAPCVDLVVQTFPEFTSVSVNQNFNWIIDITNSVTSSNAIDVLFEDFLDDVFTITGSPICQVTSGNATCMSSFTVSGNMVSGSIPNMEASSTVRITIPVSAPSFGGAFTNTAEATPSIFNNEEVTPETNISISNVQIIAPSVLKSFVPNEIFVGNQSTLTFTITNFASNEAQNNISFIDNLPQGLTIVDSPYWVENNGCTANFVGTANDDFVGVVNLNFPEAVSNCSFAVTVTSNDVDLYLNNISNFDNLNNIDASQASASLNVIVDTSNVDIEVVKSVFPEEVSIGEQVEFSIEITNLGTSPATNIEIFESLPNGYQLISFSTIIGTYSDINFIWNISELFPNQTETLILIAQVNSSNNLLNFASLFSLNETDRDDSNNEDTAEVLINDCLKVPQGISPNNDNLNDALIIPCIEDFPDNTLKIYNRNGTLIYKIKGYNNNWSGKANTGFLKTNNLLPIGTYFYILTINNTTKPIVGWVYINY